jgi:hypothetical protein
MDGGMEELVKEAYKDFHLFAEFSKHAAIIIARIALHSFTLMIIRFYFEYQPCMMRILKEKCIFAFLYSINILASHPN